MRIVRRNFSLWKTIESYWREAFPGEVDMNSRIQKRREDAKLQREISEKIAQGKIVIDEHIPEWKRGALIKVDGITYDKERDDDYDEDEEDEYDEDGIKVSNNEKSSFGLDMSHVAKFKQKLRKDIASSMDQSENVVLNKAKELYGKAKGRFTPEVYAEMRTRYPDFDLDEFEQELKHVFADMYSAYLRHDLEYIQNVCGGEAYYTFSGLIQSQIKKGLIHKSPELVNVSEFHIDSAMLTEGKAPLFVCTAKIFDIDYLVSKDDPDTLVEGNDKWGVFRDFALFIIPHPQPDVESTGHEWVIIRAEDRFKKLMLEDSTGEEKQKAADGDQKSKSEK